MVKTATHRKTDSYSILHDMARQLEDKNIAQALQLFSLAQNKGLLAENRAHPSVLVKVIGADATQHLVQALAFYPCPYCKRGRVRCKNCKGHGHLDYTLVCDACFSLGASRCECCDGSGWMALEDLPAALQAPILVSRAQNALSRLHTFMQNAHHPLSAEVGGMSLPRLAHYIAFLDRYIGVLENAIILHQKQIEETSWDHHVLDRTVRACIQTGGRAKQYLSDVLESLQESAQNEAESADPDSDAGKLARARMDFYTAQNDLLGLSGSMLEEHPFLDKAIKNAK
ncbi:hypothetical protein ACFL6U_06310 [Planctomycetota bacterium]